jgi:glycosyltransferase involved in cell wall biosynthesis
LRIGGGSRLKILEAMAMQKAIVSTSIGAEGLTVENNKNIVIADEPETFAKAIIELIEQPELRDKLAIQGMELVHKRYRWEQIAIAFDQYIIKVVNS